MTRGKIFFCGSWLSKKICQIQKNIKSQEKNFSGSANPSEIFEGRSWCKEYLKGKEFKDGQTAAVWKGIGKTENWMGLFRLFISFVIFFFHFSNTLPETDMEQKYL
jgi:adenine-specific DNA methylase